MNRSIVLLLVLGADVALIRARANGQERGSSGAGDLIGDPVREQDHGDEVMAVDRALQQAL